MRISHVQALADYLAMGDARSLRRLHEAYTADNPAAAPAIDTLKLWSRKHGWQLKAENYDQEVSRQAVALLATEEAARHAKMALSFSNVAQQSLDQALIALERGAGDPQTARDVQVLVSLAVTASMRADALLGTTK